MKTDLELLYKGKVRDIYAINNDKMLMVASDRISVFDVVFNEKFFGKGKILTDIANFWFAKTKHIVPNHLTKINANEFGDFHGSATVVKKLKPLPIEAIVRGYIVGSGWRDYQKNQIICGEILPKGLQFAEKLPTAIYTPSSKAGINEHDKNIGFNKTVDLVGLDLATKIRDISLQLYNFAAEFSLKKGVIIADTKFEFGLDENENIILMDEVLTPDSSRFWDKNKYQVGKNPISFDKQILRDYLATLNWDKSPPPPKLPNKIIKKTADKYQQIKDILLT